MYEDLMNLTEGIEELFCDPDPDRARETFRQKERALVDKTMTLKDAIAKFVKDGDYIAPGGFGQVRIPSAALYEIIRQGRKNLAFCGHSAQWDVEMCAISGVIDRCDISYTPGHELRGLSRASKGIFQTTQIKKTDWSNAALFMRLDAGAKGLSFIPARCMLGTDTLKRSAAKVIECPFTGKNFLALPALYPDVAIIHVHNADIYGNCQIPQGILLSDDCLARAAKTLIVTTERIVSNDEIRANPNATIIPYFCVDAVVEVPFGAHPANMPGEYWFDDELYTMYLGLAKTIEGAESFIKEYVLDLPDFEAYLEKVGGVAKLDKLRSLETK